MKRCPWVLSGAVLLVPPWSGALLGYSWQPPVSPSLLGCFGKPLRGLGALTTFESLDQTGNTPGCCWTLPAEPNSWDFPDLSSLLGHWARPL